MGRYIGPKNSIIKSLGTLPGLKVLKKNINENKSNSKNKTQKLKKKSDYGLKLKEKQKIRYNYGISEPQLYRYVKQIQNLVNRTKYDLLRLIELRLDNIVYNLGFTVTISSARQFINHGKIYVNSKRVTIASFNCQKDDIISLQLTKKQKKFIKLKILNFNEIPIHLKKLNSFSGKIITEFITTFKLNIEEHLIFEFYSKR